MKQGILLIAAGHPYYGNYAYQLALSLKANSNDIPVSIVYEGKGISHLGVQKLAIFDHIIEAKPQHYTSKSLGIRDIFKLKTSIYELSPYDETLYLDADMLWLPRKRVESLFAELKDVDFTMSNRGAMAIDIANEGFVQWASVADIRDAYGFKDETIFHLSSEFIYFKKNKDVKGLFDKVKKAFDYPKVNYKIFGQNQPDELSFIIATMQTKMYPHTAPYFPAYWEPFNKMNMKPADMYQQYYLCSFGGSIYSNGVRDFYNNLAKSYTNAAGEYLFPLTDKNKFLPERAVI